MTTSGEVLCRLFILDGFHQRARLNGAARYGKYTDSMEKELVGAGT